MCYLMILVCALGLESRIRNQSGTRAQILSPLFFFEDSRVSRKERGRHL